MFLGTQDILKEVRGTFKKFFYLVTIKRTKQTEHYKCFSGNDKQEHTYVDSCYARNEDSMHEICQEWSKFYQGGVWRYELVLHNKIVSNWLTVEEVITDYQTTKGLNHLIRCTDINHREIIH